MASEEGIVSKVEASMAWITTHRTRACEGCRAREGCMERGDGKEMEIQVENTLGAGPGDRVLVSVEDGAFLKVSFLLYVVPVIGLLVGASLGRWLGALWSVDVSAASAAGGLLFLSVTFFLVRMHGNRLALDRRYRPRMARILGRAAGDKGCTKHP